MIRPYKKEDKEELVELLRLNIPQYFASSEEVDFVAYLDRFVESYFVVEENGRIVGAGGINYFYDDNSARISWDIINPDFQGKGIGKKLTLHRIEEIKNKPAINKVVVRTTQLVYKFYEKMGFELERTEKDFWAKGYDLYQMEMMLHNNTTTANN